MTVVEIILTFLGVWSMALVLWLPFIIQAFQLQPPIKDTPNKGHLSIKDVPIPIIPVHFNLQIKETSL